tara:strand:+ start:836 stop:3772 length:2937 start_codon:yes stop_codon:yes gene_type:complete
MGFFKRFVKAITNPTTIITAALVIGLAIATGGLSIALTAASIGTAIAITAGVMAATQALAPIPKMPDFSDFLSESQGRTQMIKQPTVPRRVVYGKIRISGVLGYVNTSDDQQFLRIIILLTGHEINSFLKYYINDEQLSVNVVDGGIAGDTVTVTAPTKYAGLFTIKTHKGASGQSADSTIIEQTDGQWTDQHKLSGIAYIYAQIKFDRSAFPQGIPNISVLVEGKKVYDPRTQTTAYSANPALCLRDYLTSSAYGFGATSDEIGEASFITAANICDEIIDIKPNNIPFVGFPTEKRYEINGTFQTSGSPKSIVQNLLTSAGGIVSYTNGVFKIKVAKYVSPTITLDEADLRGSITLQTKRSRRDNYNAVKGQFASIKTNFILSDYPAITSDVFQAEDGGDRQFLDLDLPYTTSETMAQRLSKIALYRNRQQVSITYPASLKGFQLDVGDTVMVNNASFGFSSKVFEVAEWSMNIDNSNGSPTLGTNLVLRELNSAVYDWDENTDEKQFLLDNTILPNPFEIVAPSLTVTDELRVLNEEAISTLTAEVGTSNAQVTDFEVEAKKSNESTYVSMGKSSATKFELLNVEDSAVYNVRARAVSRFAVSAYTTDDHQVVGKTAPPQNVSGFSINIITTEAHLSWIPVTDLDLSHYRIRHSRDTSTSATYANSVDLVAKVSRPANTAVVPAMTGTYFIKAVDKLGNDSLDSTRSVAIIENIKDLNLVATSTQNPNFTGSKSSTVVVDNELRLGTSILFDAGAGNFDTTGGLFDGGGGTVASSGTYDFDNYIDVGAIYTSRVTANIVLSRIDYGLEFDDATGQFDDREGLFDGDANEFGTTNAELQISTTTDDPAGSPTWTDYRKFFVGDYKARGLRFRALLSTLDSESTPSLSALSVTVDMPDRVIADDDIVSGAGAKAVSFSPNFKGLQGVGISAQNLASGDYYVISNKTVSGFTITFYNSSDSAISRTFDYVAKGYGEIAA